MSVEKTNEKQETHLDDVLERFPLNGRYHVVFITLMIFMCLGDSLHCSNYVFVVEDVKYWCKDARFVNNSCTKLENSTEVCTEWMYDNPNSFVAEFQLACQDWKRTLVGTVHNFGYGVGLLFLGPLSDRFGRKAVIIVASVFAAVFGVSRSFATSYWIYIALEFIEAAAGNVFSAAFILTMEMVAQDKRILCKLFTCLGVSMGFIILPLASWLIPYWRNLLRLLYAPMILTLSYIYLLDESPRWLLSKGEKAKAVSILKKAAKTNRITIEDKVLQNLHYEDKERGHFLKLIKSTLTSPILLIRFLICLTWWVVFSFVMYGIRVNIVLLPGNKYINYGLMAFVDVPARMFITFILIKFRRKGPLIGSFFLAAVFFFIQPFVPTDLPWLSIVLFMAGFTMSSAFSSTIYIFTSEIFPTYTRNSMHSLCSALGRVGAVTAPLTPLLMQYWHGLPSITFALASLIAALVTFGAPDTADDALPDTVHQAEALNCKPKDKIDANVPRSPVSEKDNTRL